MTPHIEAAPGDYAPSVLLPGDPQRATWIAETFLDDARCVNQIRGALGYTGTYRGKPVSIQSTGMGRPSLAIYLNELVQAYGVRLAVRIGTCGGLHEDIGIRAVFIAEDAILEHDLAAGASVERPDQELLQSAREHAAALGHPWHCGPILCSDVFYHPKPDGRFDAARAAGKLAVDMETSAVFAEADRLGIRALSICTVVDNPVTGTEIDPSERHAVCGAMARAASSPK